MATKEKQVSYWITVELYNIIQKLEKYREKSGIYYEENYAKHILKYKHIIEKNGIIDNCENKTRALELCAMNGIYF